MTAMPRADQLAHQAWAAAATRSLISGRKSSFDDHTVANADQGSDACDAFRQHPAADEELIAKLASEPVSTPQIVFIDSTVPDYQSLIRGFAPGTEAHVLAADQDGLVQIAKILHDRSGITAVSIISHGSEAHLKLGSAILDSANIDSYSAELKALGEALTPGGDLKIYGCNVGSGCRRPQLCRRTRAQHGARRGRIVTCGGRRQSGRGLGP